MESAMDFGRLRRCCAALVVFLVISLALIMPALAQDDGGEAAAKALNPLSDIWSMQDQVNFTTISGGMFPQSETQFTNNFQPVMPVPIGLKTNLVTRFVLPYVKNPILDPSTGETEFRWGRGDAIGAHLIVPPPLELGGGASLQVGAGITYQMPTSSNRFTGAGLWQMGAAGAAVFKTKKVLLGVFPQHWQSMGGTDNLRPAQRSTNIQYFYWYFVTPSLTVGAAPNILIDWTKDERNRYTVPIGIGGSYTTKLGGIPVKFQIEYHCAVKHPEDIPGQRNIIRFTITPVLPNPFSKK